MLSLGTALRKDKRVGENAIWRNSHIGKTMSHGLHQRGRTGYIGLPGSFKSLPVRENHLIEPSDPVPWLLTATLKHHMKMEIGVLPLQTLEMLPKIKIPLLSHAKVKMYVLLHPIMKSCINDGLDGGNTGATRDGQDGAGMVLPQIGRTVWPFDLNRGSWLKFMSDPA